MFNFVGEIPASKSILNRILVLQSFAPALQVHGDSDCDDVVAMKNALRAVLSQASEGRADCGAAGTTLRFLALRASRLTGRYELFGSARLLARPQEGLLSVIRQLGCTASLSTQSLVIESNGWQRPHEPILVDRSQSSQFASAVVLSAWNLDFDLELSFTGAIGREFLSQGYFDMTLDLVRLAGMRLETTTNGIVIGKQSSITARELTAELDLSSAFAIAALASLCGRAELRSFPQKSSQPDSIFPEILAQMGASVRRESSALVVSRALRMKSVQVNLADSPDLFPVLATLCAFADGESVLFGAPHLANKESSRIESTASLLKSMGCKFEVLPDGMRVFGSSDQIARRFAFDPLDDHRLAMAAALAKFGGHDVQVLHPNVVNKSFPQFWSILETAQLASR